MTCTMKGCEHEASVEMRVLTGRWKGLCGCCADFFTLFWYIAGQRVEARAIETKAITDDDVLNAHDALAKMDRLGVFQ